MIEDGRWRIEAQRPETEDRGPKIEEWRSEVRDQKSEMEY
jgi:hypothetical protein